MSEFSGYFDNVREYSADEDARLIRSLSTNGVSASIGGFLAVSTYAGITVAVATGYARINGRWYYLDTATTVALTAAHATLSRIDRVVVRLTTALNLVTLTLLTGTPAASPVAPALQQNEAVWELPLCQIALTPSLTDLNPGHLTDQRAFAGPDVHDLITGHGGAYAANRVAASPTSGAAGAMTARALVGADLPTPPHARMRRNIAWSVSNSLVEKLDLNLADRDTGLHISSDASRLVAPIAGLYAIYAAVTFEANAAGLRVLYLMHMGSSTIAVDYRDALASGPTAVQAYTEYPLAAAEYVNAQLYQTSGAAAGSLPVVIAAESPVVGMRWLCP